MSEEITKTAETTEFDEDDDLDIVDEDIDELDDEDVGDADADNDEVTIENDTEGDHDATVPEEKKDDDKLAEETRKPKGEKSSEQAEQRRQRERERIRNDAIKEAVGTNPFTGEKIEDDTDVEEYLVMKRIADRGGDPIAEYAKELKKSIRAVNKTIEEQLRVENEQAEHLASHPEDAELLESVQFKRFAEKLKGVKVESIVDAYKMVENSAEKKEAAKVAQANANRKASPGSVKGSAETVSANEGLYTLEQLKKMSPDELDKNWEKVEKSYAKLQKRK